MIDKGQGKAIYLGCNPSNRSNDTFEYEFALEGTNRGYNQFISSHQKDLDIVGLKWDDLYVQNLCQNYFQDETSKNLKLWKQVAREFWIGQLNNELSIFPDSIPILLTSQYLLEVLYLKSWLSTVTKKYRLSISMNAEDQFRFLRRRTYWADP